jgi:hypothetical protein
VLGFHTGRCSPFSPGPEKLLQSSRTARRLPLLLTTYAPSRVKIFKNKDRPALVKKCFFFSKEQVKGFIPQFFLKIEFFFSLSFVYLTWTSRSIFFLAAVVVLPPPLQFHLVAVELFSEISYAVPGFGCALSLLSRCA